VIINTSKIVGLLFNYIFSYRNFVRVPPIKEGKKRNILQRILSLRTKGVSFVLKDSLNALRVEELLWLLMLESFWGTQKGERIEIEYEEYFDFYGVRGEEKFDISLSPFFYFLSKRYKKDINLFFRLKGFQEGKGYCDCYEDRHKYNPFSCGYSRKVRYEEPLGYLHGGGNPDHKKNFYPKIYGGSQALTHEEGQWAEYIEYYDLASFTTVKADLPLPSNVFARLDAAEIYRKKILKRKDISYSLEKNSLYALEGEREVLRDYVAKNEAKFLWEQRLSEGYRYISLYRGGHISSQERNMLNILLERIYHKRDLQKDFLIFLEKKYGPFDMMWNNVFQTTTNWHVHTNELLKYGWWYFEYKKGEEKERIWNGWFWDGEYPNAQSFWHYGLYVKSLSYEGKEGRDIKRKGTKIIIDKYLF